MFHPDVVDVQKLPLEDRIDLACDEFEREWKEGSHPEITLYVKEFPAAERPLLEEELRRVAFELNCTAIESRLGGVTLSDGTRHTDVLPTRYAIQRLIASGGCGRVYLARDTLLDRDVAIKLPHPDLVAQTTMAGALLAEGRTAASLEHAAIVPVYDCGTTQRGVQFIVSKYIEGTDLSSLVGSQSSRAHALAWMIEIADAIAHAHALGVVHRDIKPHNVIIDRSGRPFVTDFGLAVPLRAVATLANKGLHGTIPYMSPEQAAEQVDQIDLRSDVFSLGVMLYELLTGKRPFYGATPEEILEHVRACKFVPPSAVLPELDPRLERICLKAMSADPRGRYPTAAELRDALVDCQQPTHQQPTRAHHSLRRWACGAAVAAALVGLAGWQGVEHRSGLSALLFAETPLTGRDLAHWVLDQGGTISIATTSESETPIALPGDLPSGAFSLQSIALLPESQVDGDDLFQMLTRSSELRGLSALRVLSATAPTARFNSSIDAPQLQQLWLNYSDFGDAELALFRRATALKHLNLNGTWVSDDSGPLMATFGTLEYLDTSNTRVTSAFVDHFRDHQSLEVLRLESTLVDDRTIAVALSLPHLRQLDVWDTRITKGGIASFRAARPNCRVSFEQTAYE